MRIGVGARRLGRKEIQRIAAVLLKKVGKAVIVGYVKLIPVVKSRAPQLAVVYLKAERAHKMKRSTRRRAGAGDVAGILRDLRLHKNDINISQGNTSKKIFSPRSYTIMRYALRARARPPPDSGYYESILSDSMRVNRIRFGRVRFGRMRFCRVRLGRMLTIRFYPV